MYLHIYIYTDVSINFLYVHMYLDTYIYIDMCVWDYQKATDEQNIVSDFRMGATFINEQFFNLWWSKGSHDTS